MPGASLAGAARESGFAAGAAAVLLLACVAASPSAGASTPLAPLEDRLAAARTAATARDTERDIAAAEQAALSPTVGVLLGGARQALAAGHPDQSVADLDSAIDLQPDSALLWRERALARIHTGDLAGAVADLGHAIDRDPRDVAAWSLLSSVASLRGQNDAAFAAWQKVMALEPARDGGSDRLQTLRRKAFGDRA